jgi:hypothetical protein
LLADAHFEGRVETELTLGAVVRIREPVTAAICASS